MSVSAENSTKEHTSPEDLTMIFNSWAIKNQLPIRLGYYRDFEGKENHGAPYFDARLSAYEVSPPSESEWFPELAETGQGVLLRAGVLEAAIGEMRRSSYTSRHFKESGGVGLGLQCICNEGRYHVPMVYVPLPDGASSSGGSLTFDADAWSEMLRIRDRYVEENNLGQFDFRIVTWFHCHPGKAFESDLDSGVQVQSGDAWCGVVVGNDLLNSSPANLTISQITDRIRDRELHLITHNKLPGSFGRGDTLLAEYFMDMDIVASNEMPVLATSRSGQNVGQEDLVRIVPEKSKRTSRPSGILHISLAEISQPDHDEIKIIGNKADIVITSGDLDDTVENFEIRILGVDKNRLEKVLDQIKLMFGF